MEKTQIDHGFAENTLLFVACGTDVVPGLAVEGGVLTAMPIGGSFLLESAGRQGAVSDLFVRLTTPEKLREWANSFIRKPNVNKAGVRDIAPALSALLQYKPNHPVISHPVAMLRYALDFLNHKQPRNAEHIVDALNIIKQAEGDPVKQRRAMVNAFRHVRAQVVDLLLDLYIDGSSGENHLMAEKFDFETFDRAMQIRLFEHGG